jgi:hypothetical protein
MHQPGTFLRLSIFLLLGVLGLAATEVRAQAERETRHTVAMRSVPLGQALERFIEQTKADIAYSTDLVDGRTAYCRIRDAAPEALLRCILSGTGVDYLRTSGGTYLLVEGVRAPDARSHIVGTVVDATTGEPLPRANVLLADASTGTSTNDDGRFRFASVLSGPHRLLVTYIGYATSVDTIWVPTDRPETITVRMEPRVLDSEPLIVDGLQQRLPSTSLGQGDVDPRDGFGLGSVVTPGVLRSASRQTGVSVGRPRANLNVQGGGDGENVTLLDGAPVREPVNLGGLLSAFSPDALGRLQVHKTGFLPARGSYTGGVVEASHDLRRVEAGGGRAAAEVRVDPVSASGRADATWTAGESRGATRTGQAMVAARRSVWDAYRDPGLHRLLDTWSELDPTLAAWWTSPSAGDASPTGSAERTLQAQLPSSDVQFTDLHAAVRQELSPFRSLYVSGYHGSNHIGTTIGSLLGDGRETQQLRTATGRNDWDNTVAQVRYDWVADGRTMGSLQMYGSRHASQTFFGLRDSLVQTVSGNPPEDQLRAALDDAAVDPRRPQATDHSAERNQLTEVGARGRVDVSLSPTYHLEAGLEPRRFRGEFYVRNRFLGALGHRADAWQVGSYVQGTASVDPGLTVTAGTRFTYVAARQSVYAEPRGSVRLDRSGTRWGDVAVRVAGGLYRQYVLQAEVSNAGPNAVVPSVQFWLPLDGTLSPPRTYHAAADALLRPNDRWTLRLETYAKWHPRTVSVDYAGLVRPDPLADARTAPERRVGRQEDLFAVGDGRAMGAAFRVQRDGSRVRGNLTAEVSRVHRRYPGRFGNRFVPAPWETPVQVSADAELTLLDGVAALGSWQGLWNRPWALRRAYYDYVASAGRIDAFDLNRPGAQRLAPYSRFDVGVRAQGSVRGVTLETRIQVVNVLDAANAFDWSLDRSTRTVAPRTLPGRRLHLSVRVQVP